MIMKKIKITYLKSFLAALLLSAYGCNDWLDVNPRTEIKEPDIYSGETGFKNVMNGIYIQMASSNLYGKNMSFYFPDLLAQLWTPNSNSTEEYIADFAYSNATVESVIDNIWSTYYTCVAHVNNILENLQTTDVAFSHGNKELLMGEAYGLRAFLHLEVLRFFGPVPAEATDATEAIPYITELTKDPNKLTSLTYGEVKQMILQDLDSAEVYLQNDPFTLGSMDDLNNPGSTTASYVPDDDWHYYRQTHFNHYAVDATRARYYQWIGDGEQAAVYARRVIEATNPDGNNKFTLTNEASYSDSYKANLVFQSEHIFALDCSNHQSMIEGIFDSSNNPDLYTTQRYVNSIYENEANDIRNVSGRYWDIDGNTACYLKYLGSGTIDPLDQIPLIRLAEMYLILIENTPMAEAAQYFDTFRQARGMSQSMTLSENDRLERVEYEYRKEFYGEGQMFYWYKRHNVANYTMPARFAVPVGGYVVPMPNSQTAFE